MWRQLSKSLNLLAIAICLGIPGLAGVNVPDWARQAAATQIKAYPPETKAVVLLDQTDLTVLDSGDYIEHSRHVVKLLRPDGRGERNLSVELGQQEKVNFLHGWSIDASGREYEVKEKDFTEEGPYARWLLYSDIRFRTAKAAAPYAGTVIAFEYEVRRHPWLNQISLFLQDDNPVKRGVITMSLPAGWEFKASWSDALPIQPVQTGRNQWMWSFAELSGFEPEPHMPAVYTLVPRMALAFFKPGERVAVGSWEGVGRWYAQLTSGRRDSTPDITRRTAELIAGKSDFDSSLRAVTGFLQDQIRYVAIEIGIGGFQPHPAGDTFRERYGDCKDKVTLLIAMLQTAGVHSDYVLIHTHRGLVRPSVPSSAFNHAIIAIEIPDDVKSDQYHSVIVVKSGKRYIIFDPTDEYTPVGSLRGELQNSYALLVTDSGGELIRTPLLSPDSNSIIRNGHFVLSANGALSGEVSEDRGGDFAMEERYRLRYTDERERNNDFERWLGSSIQGFTLNGMKIENADQITQDLLTDYKFSTPQYGQPRGPLMLVRPRVLDQKSSYVEHKSRHYALELGRTTRQTDTYEIEIPKEYQVDDIPRAVKIDVGFASYESRTEVEGSKLRYWREYVVRDLSVPPEKFADWTRLQGVIGADETAAVVLKRVP